MDSHSFYTKTLEDELGSVKKIILENIKSPDPEIFESLKKLVTAKSKMLRPALLILSSKFGNTDSKITYSLAAAVEMLHTATLIHDDIIDRASTRRGAKTLHSIFGPGRSVLLGDFLLSRGYKLILPYIEKENLNRLNSVISYLCESEITEISSAFKTDITERKYLRRIAGKTASLFALSCHIGASESNAGKEIISALTKCGYCIGMAFQIIDDILDFKSSEKVLGKPACNDIQEGIYTLPVIYALKVSGEKYKKELGKIKKNKSIFKSARIKKIVKMTEETGALERAKSQAEKYTNRALKEIEKLPDEKTRDEITSIIKNMLARKF